MCYRYLKNIEYASLTPNFTDSFVMRLKYINMTTSSVGTKKQKAPTKYGHQFTEHWNSKNARMILPYDHTQIQPVGERFSVPTTLVAAQRSEA